MRQENLPRLDEFLNVINAEVRTTRRASEKFFNSPSLDVAVEGERELKTTLDKTYENFTPDNGDAETKSTVSPQEVKALYWEKARHVSTLSGAKEVDSVCEYFHVAADRSAEAICEEVRELHAGDSTPGHFLRGVETYMDALSIDPMTAARIATTNLKYTLPMLKKATEGFTRQGYDPVVATSKAFAYFTDDITPKHIEDISKKDKPLTSMLNKRSFYTTVSAEDQGELPLRMSRKDAEGIMSVYRLERRPYSKEELALGEELIQDPDIQASLLLFQMAIVDYSDKYLERHPERKQHSLLPFSEFFVPDQDLGLIPNPKLIKVLGNNLMPAIASQLIKSGGTIDDLTSSQIADSALEAKKRRVFQAQIGRFNNYDEETDTVDLDAIFNRTCPAMQVLTNSLTTWLPDIYDHLKASSN